MGPEDACCSPLQSLLQDLPTLVNTVVADLLTDLYCSQVRSQLGASDQDLPTLVNTVVADLLTDLYCSQVLLTTLRGLRTSATHFPERCCSLP